MPSRNPFQAAGMLVVSFFALLSMTLSTTIGIVGVAKADPPGKQCTDRALKEQLQRSHDLREKRSRGQTRYYRLTATLDQFDLLGRISSRTQLRGDIERRVTGGLDPNGRTTEQVRWRNVGFRPWSKATGEYGKYVPLSWADNFSYEFSVESKYDAMNWDLTSIPKDHTGYLFRAVLSVTAHYEFDFMRSSAHGRIDQLTKIGQLITDLPEEGQKFSLNHPPVVKESVLERMHIQVGLPGITIVNGEPCAILEFRQGPQDFALLLASARGLKLKLKSWQYGQCLIRLADGGLVSAQMTENTISNAASATPSYGKGNYFIQEISPAEFEKGLTEWNNDRRYVSFIQASQAHDSTLLNDSSRACETVLTLKPQRHNTAQFRLTLTRQNMDPRGELRDLSQLRGDMTLSAAGKGPMSNNNELVTWRNVGARLSPAPSAPYGPYQRLPGTEKLSYVVSPGGLLPLEGITEAIGSYNARQEDFISLAKTGNDFSSLLSLIVDGKVSLRQPGDVLFLDAAKYPFLSYQGPRENTQDPNGAYLRFLGFTEVSGQTSALIDFLYTPVSQQRTIGSSHEARTVTTTTWRYGVLAVSLTSGGLANGEISERQLRSFADATGQGVVSDYLVTNYQLERLNPTRLALGLDGWNKEQSRRPVGRIYNR